MLVAGEEIGEDAVPSGESRQLRLVNDSYRDERWILTETGSVIDLFERLKRFAVRREDHPSVVWYCGKSVGHLENRGNLSDSPLLRKLGLTVSDVFVDVSVCSDLVLLVDLSVRASNGEFFSRTECRAFNLERHPTPDIIIQRRDEIRRHRPRTDYMDQWVGFESGGIREFNVMEVFRASS